MTSNARNNEYWLRRLAKDGHNELIDRVRAGDLSMYEARGLAGYRKSGPRSPAAKLSYHWQRASAEERQRFVAAHLTEINRVLKDTARILAEMKAQKPNS